MSESFKLAVRPFNEHDRAFVFSTWLKAYRDSPFAANISKTVYYKMHHALLESILRRATTRVLIAHPEGDPGTILGWLCYEDLGERKLVHGAYVKLSWRGIGVFTHLLQAAGIDWNSEFDYTHQFSSRNVDDFPRATYNPYLV